MHSFTMQHIHSLYNTCTLIMQQRLMMHKRVCLSKFTALTNAMDWVAKVLHSYHQYWLVVNTTDLCCLTQPVSVVNTVTKYYIFIITKCMMITTDIYTEEKRFYNWTTKSLTINDYKHWYPSMLNALSNAMDFTECTT